MKPWKVKIILKDGQQRSYAILASDWLAAAKIAIGMAGGIPAGLACQLKKGGRQ